MLKKLLSLIATLSFLTNCSTLRLNKDVDLEDKSKIEDYIRRKIEIEEINTAEVQRKIKKFHEILKSKKTLSKSDWRLHDELLETYVQLKHYPRENILEIPAKTKITLPLKSYCLDSWKATPVTNEIYKWTKMTDQPIRYLAKILKLSKKGTYPQKTLQSLIWNLKNRTIWEEYPDLEKSILMELDPQAPKHLPSQLGSQVKNELLNEARSYLPEGVSEIADFIEGKYYQYKDFEEVLERLSSKAELPEQKLSSVEKTSLYAENHSEGYKQQTTAFYNTKDEPQKINLLDYYQKPFRKDVQPLAGYFALKGNAQLLKELESLLFDEMLRLGLSSTPVLGDLIDLYEASTGKDFFSDEWLSNTDRFMSAMGVLAGSGYGYRYAKKVVEGPPRYVREVQKKYRQVRNSKAYKGLEDLAEHAYGKGIPDDWPVKASKINKKEPGLVFTHPENKHKQIRVMPGHPGHKHINSSDPYVRIQKNGSYYDRFGNKAENPDVGHIPLKDFDFSKLKKGFWDE